MTRLVLSVMLMVTALALPAVAAAQETYAVDPAQSTLIYRVIHKLHKVEGTSKQAAGKAVIAPSGKAQVLVTVPSETFDSGNVNRDAHMKEAVESAKYPKVELKALAEGVTPPQTFPTTQNKTVKLQLAFHGETKVFDIPAQIVWESKDRVRVSATFNVSLDAYKVERPSLMFVKVDDALVIEAKLLFKK